MITIHKFELQVTDLQKIKMPVRRRVLTAQVQNGTICLWAQVDTESDMEEREVSIIGTGNPLPENHEEYTYLTSVQMRGGLFVWHIFWK